MQDSLRRLVRNTEAMSDGRAAEVTPRTLTAFGIRLTSRFGKAAELVQLLEFARLAAEAAVAQHVAEVRYDGDATGARFRLQADARPDPAALSALLGCAIATIARFAWVDGQRYGADMPA